MQSLRNGNRALATIGARRENNVPDGLLLGLLVALLVSDLGLRR